MSVFQHLRTEEVVNRELAERAQFAKQPVGYRVDNLDQPDYLARRPNPTNQCVTLVCLTELG